jgi:DNA adenine methylase
MDAVNSLTPLLKWPGGKRFLVRQIASLSPVKFRRYFEPFLGGGAVFFALSPNHAIISDSDEELINCYRQIRDSPESVIARLRRLKNNEQEYYKIRASKPRTDVGRAARLVYLISLSFNGIYRLNTFGQFNVPYGRKTHLRVCNPIKIREISRALARAQLECCDFSRALDSAGRGDLVYLDPPYTVAHGNNGFLKYNAKIFSWKDQERLARTAHALARKGCSVIVSNADHISIRELYREFHVLQVQRPSNIAANKTFRVPTTECVFYKMGEKQC